MTLELKVTTGRPAGPDRQVVARGLAAHNRAAYGRRLPRDERWILVRDEAGAVQAGARCEIGWGWLYLDWLWVAEGLRGGGLGTRLLAAAETLARQEGCLGLHLHTASFQAPDFYRKRGFLEVGRVEDMPPGAVRYWFARRF